MAPDTIPARSRRSGAVRAALIALVLAAVALGFVEPASVSAATTTVATTVAVTEPAFFAYEQGTLATGSGAERNASAQDNTKRIRLVDKVAVDGSWTSMTFAGADDIQIIVFAYGTDGAFIAQSSTGWDDPSGAGYTWALPAGTAFVDLVVRHVDSSLISAGDRTPWLTISATAGDDTSGPPDDGSAATPVPLADPRWNEYEQGTIASADGAERDNPSDLATRIRLADALTVDPSWQALRLDAGMHGAGLSVTIFAYDAGGRFISPSSGWKPLSSPLVYRIPAGTQKLDWALTHDTGGVAPISVGEQAQWLTLTDVVPDPRANYTVDAHPIAAQFTIPGIVASQGGNFVAGNLWEATASDDGEGAANGEVYVYSIDYQQGTATLIHRFTHNFGHLNSFSYDPAGSNLIFGNGSGSYTQPPRFYVVEAANIDLDGTNTLAGVDATVFTVPADFGAKANVIWTDEPGVAVMLTDDGSRVRKIRLATGTEQLDLGDYTPAAEGRYNGTWTVLATYQIDSAFDVVQSASWVAGHLVIGLGHGPLAVAVIDLEDDGHLRYVVHRDAANPQFFESLFYDPVNRVFGGGNAHTGTAWFWDDTNFQFVAVPTGPEPVVPEAPLALLLPLSAGGLGGLLLAGRRRVA